MSVPQLHGILPPFPTPVTAAGKVDESALRKMLHMLIDAGVQGLVPIGGTGEYTALSPQDRQRVVAISVEVADGRVPVIAGMVSPGFAESVSAGKAFKDAGADVLLAVTPFYVSPTQNGIRDYFRAYREAVDLPILFYDVPYRTRIVTEAQTIAEMEADGSIFGMKACNTDMAHFNQVMSLTSPAFQMLSGEDLLYPAHAALGAQGAILASSPLLPHYWLQLYESIKAGHLDEAIAAQRRLLPLLNALFCEANPGPLKAAMKMIGQSCGDVLSPLQAPSAATVERLRNAMADLREAGLVAA